MVATVAHAQESVGVATGKSEVREPHYTVWAYGVNGRDSVADWKRCENFPSVGACPDIFATINRGDDLIVMCQRPGEIVGGNPYWVKVFGAVTGWRAVWVASHFIDYPDDVLPNVPRCDFVGDSTRD